MKELELIIQAITQLGEAGKEAFIWWLFVDKGITSLLIATALFLAYKLVIRLIRAFADAPIERLRDEMGVGSPGPLFRSEYEQMIHWIREKRGEKRTNENQIQF